MFCFAFFSPLIFSKRLVLVFSLHSFPFISFVFVFVFLSFVFLGGDLELGAGVLVLFLLSLLLFNGCLCFFLRRFGANWILC